MSETAQETPQKQILGSLVKAAVATSELTESQVAMLLGVSQPQGLLNIYLGITPLTQEQIEKLCKRLDIEPEPMIKAAQEWYRAPKDPQVKLEPGETRVSSTVIPAPRDMLDELAWAIQDFNHAAGVLEEFARKSIGTDADVAQQTSAQLMAAARRITKLLTGSRPPNHQHATPVPEGEYGPPVERFEVGKVYKHPSGKLMKILGEVDTMGYGTTLVGEDISCPNLLPIGSDSMAAQHWWEARESDWLALWLEANPTDENLKHILELVRAAEKREEERADE